MSTRGDKAVAKTLLEDLEGLLAEAMAEPVEEATKRAKAPMKSAASGKKSGKALEKKMRENKKSKEKEGKTAGASKTHSPFKRRSVNGPASGGPTGKKRVTHKTGKWHCKGCTGYKNCTCTNSETGKKKIITRGSQRKSQVDAYNPIYKDWARHQPRTSK